MSAFFYTYHRKLHCLNVDDYVVENGKQLKKIASDLCGGIPEQDLSVIHNGHLVTDDRELLLQDGDVCYASLLLPGGKGGFGSMLRAIGAQIEKTTNREACRDLSGRRMRDINDEKKIAEWVSKQAEREREKEQKKQERLARRSMPKHMFDDKTYTQNIQQNSERIEAALHQGLKAAGSSRSSGASSTSEKAAGKRVHPGDPTISGGGKKSRLWLGMEDLSDSGDDEEGMAPVRSNDNEDPSRHTCTSTGVSCSSTQAEVAVPEEASDNRHCVDTDCKIAKPPAQPSETNAESQKEDTKTEHIRAAVADTKDPREDFQEKDGMTEKVTRGEEDNKATEEETIRKVEFCLDSYSSAEELESLGLEHLKEELMSRGLKCGGTLQQRAQRLFATKGVSMDQLDPSFFAKSTGGKKSNGKK